MSNSKAITSGLSPELYKLIIVAVCSTLSDKFNHHHYLHYLLSLLYLIIRNIFFNNFNNHINTTFVFTNIKKFL